jgi:hypothetical protein
MKRALKYSLIFLFTISLTAILADSINVNIMFSHNHPDCVATCNDLSNHVEDTHSPCSQDDLVTSDFNSHKTELQTITTLFSYSSENKLFRFTNNIWQPPKLS